MIWGIIAPESLTAVTGAILDFLIGDIGWVYVLAVCGFVGICVFLVFSRYGHIRLGKDDDRPEFRTISWISMMFAAGMGIGLLFYGVAEPISHFAAPPPGLADPKTEEAARIAMQYTFLHWGVTGWSIYAIAGLALAYFGYRHGGRNLVSTACRPILGDRVDGMLGKSLDAAAVLATLFGLIPSLGMGALQVNGAMEFVWGVPNSATVQMIFIAVVTVMFVLSATTGVGKGVQFLANFSMLVAIVIALFVRRRRSDPLHLQQPDREHRALRLQLLADDVPHRHVQPGQLGAELDHLLLGVVDLVGPVRRHLHRPHLQGADHPRVRARRAAAAGGGEHGLVRDLRRHRDQPRADPRRSASSKPSRRARPRRCSRCSTSSRWPGSSAPP